MWFQRYEREAQDVNARSEDIVFIRDENGRVIELEDAEDVTGEVIEDACDN